MATRAHALPPNPAPWAEVVPGMGPVTVDLLLTIPDDEYVYEVVDGVLVRMAGSGDEATTIAGVIHGELYAYVRPRRLGIVTPADGVYKFPGAETGLIPDVGFYTAAREATIPDEDADRPIPFAPDLAVEVASPSQDADAMAAKARTYLGGGTRLVWVVWPQAHHIDVWRAGTLDLPARTLNAGDTLEGEDVVPGFTHPVAAVFDDPWPSYRAALCPWPSCGGSNATSRRRRSAPSFLAPFDQRRNWPRIRAGTRIAAVMRNTSW
jgi:Uma2 family endonuclease